MQLNVDIETRAEVFGLLKKRRKKNYQTEGKFQPYMDDINALKKIIEKALHPKLDKIMKMIKDGDFLGLRAQNRFALLPFTDEDVGIKALFIETRMKEDEYTAEEDMFWPSVTCDRQHIADITDKKIANDLVKLKEKFIFHPKIVSKSFVIKTSLANPDQRIYVIYLKEREWCETGFIQGLSFFKLSQEIHDISWISYGDGNVILMWVVKRPVKKFLGFTLK